MSTFPNFFRSLLLTALFSFAAPTLLVGAMLASLFPVSYLPGLEIVGQAGIDSILNFLATFGNGCPVEGMLAIALTCGFVGAIFDTYAFYRYQALRGN